jgi:hypothetical protein
MSKKILVLLLALVMVLTVVACDKDPKPGPDNDKPNSDATDAPDTTDATGAMCKHPTTTQALKCKSKKAGCRTTKPPSSA